MEHSEESAAEPEPQRARILHFVFDGAIIEGKFFEAVFEFVVVGAVDGVDAGVDVGSYFFESRDEVRFQKILLGDFRRLGMESTHDGVSDFYVSYGFLSGGDVSDLSLLERRISLIFWCEISDFCGGERSL